MVTRIPIVERKIYFYRVNLGRSQDGAPLPFDPIPVLKGLSALPFEAGPAGRYEDEGDGNVICVLPSEERPEQALRFCRVRRVGLPQIEREGNIWDLDIHPDEGLLEPTHAVFFDNNVAGIEYNHYGPRASRLGTYINGKKLDDVPSIHLAPLLRRDIVRLLHELTEIRLLEFRIRASYIDAVRQADESLAAAFEANLRVLNDADSIQVVLRSSKHRRRSAFKRLSLPIGRLLQRSDLHENVQQFKVRGYSETGNRVETLDLLNNYVVKPMAIPRIHRRSRALDATAVFGAIDRAYEQLKSDIDTALTIENGD